MTRLCMERLATFRDRLEADVAAGLIPGATVVVGHRNHVLFEQSVGFRDVALGDKLQSNAVWRIYSMTKPVVTAAAMVLVERGLLRLDQMVVEFLPAFANPRVATGEQTSVPAEAPPTIQDLMRHTAGLAYGYLGDSPAHRALVADRFLAEDAPLAAFVDRLAALPLEYQPGTVWHYSHATDVLGRVVEVVSGMDLQGALTDTLLGPLAMAETRFRLPERDRERVAQPLAQAPGTRPSFFDPCDARQRQSGGGGLVSTAGDYARFLRMLLNGGRLDGERVLSPATVRYMTSDHLGSRIRHAPYYPPGPGYGFGLGFAVRLTEGEAAFPGTRGDFFWSGVGGTAFWVDPARDLFALLLLQSASAPQRQHYRTLMRSMVYAALVD